MLHNTKLMRRQEILYSDEINAWYLSIAWEQNMNTEDEKQG